MAGAEGCADSQIAGRCVRVWLPDVVLPAGDRLRAALEGPAGANFLHLRRKHPGSTFRVFGAANPTVPPWKRLQVVAQCQGLALPEKVESDVLDLAETACDIVADGLGLSDEQVQQSFEDLRVERSDIKIQVSPKGSAIAPLVDDDALPGISSKAPPPSPPRQQSQVAPSSTAARTRKSNNRSTGATSNGREVAAKQQVSSGTMLPPANVPSKKRKKHDTSNICPAPSKSQHIGASPLQRIDQESVAPSISEGARETGKEIAPMQFLGEGASITPKRFDEQGKTAARSTPDSEMEHGEEPGESSESSSEDSAEDEEEEEEHASDESCSDAQADAIPVDGSAEHAVAQAPAFRPVKVKLLKLGEFCGEALACFAGGNPRPQDLTKKHSIDQRTKLDHCKEHMRFAGDESITFWNYAPTSKSHARGIGALGSYFVSKQRVGLVELPSSSLYVIPPDAAFLEALDLAKRDLVKPGCLLGIHIPTEVDIEDDADEGILEEALLHQLGTEPPPA